MRIYNADTGRFSTFGYGQIDFKYMPGGCRSDPRFHLIHVGLDFFLLTGCYSCNYFKERGIRTYDDYTRNTLDLAAVPMLKELTHLPVIVDPSHATGIARLVRPMALAAAACGSDGLIIEVHNDPIHALCDGAQSLRPEQYDDLAKAVRRVREAVAE